ncbi:MAG: SPFH domain-containing protein [Aquabacterium sp.]
MTNRLKTLIASIRQAFTGRIVPGLGQAAAQARDGLADGGRRLAGARRTLLTLAIAGGATALLVTHPPVATVDPGAVAVRLNLLTGDTAEFREGSLWRVPGLHEVRQYALRDQLYRLPAGRKGGAEAPFQSVEGLSFGVDLTVRWALEASRVRQVARSGAADLGGQVVDPAVQGVVYRLFSRYTMREIFSAKRAEIQQAIETELRGRLAAEGLVLKGVQIGKVELPAEYRHGMERLLAEELRAEQMRHTLDLKEKQVRQTELEAQADKVRRETAAAASASEHVIAARAQEEAMRHVLPFKTKQIEQRQLEAQADKLARIRAAEGMAEARRIEAAGEADSRRRLADAEAYRQDQLGRIASAQMARDGELITRHPLLIHKTMADKLSDKIQVIVAPPHTDGRFIAAGLVGGALPEGAAVERSAAAVLPKDEQ